MRAARSLSAAQPLQRLVEREQLLGAVAGEDGDLVDGYALPLAAALFRLSSHRVVHQDPAHGSSGDGEKVAAIAPLDAIEAGELEVGFMH